MKILKVLPFLLIAAIGVSAVGPARVSRDALVAGEKSIGEQLPRLWNDLGLIGAPRGVYLEGYGAVFTAEVTVATAPISMMGDRLTPQRMEEIKATKLKRLPDLKKALKQQLVKLATSLDIPPDENVTIALLLLRYPGEEKLPIQITVQASKRKLLDAKDAATLDQVVRVSELY
jgi:hypothetical protein